MTSRVCFSLILIAAFLLSFLPLYSLAQSRARPPNQRNVTIPSTSPQIVYTPLLCNATAAASRQECRGAWQIINDSFVTTTGPDLSSSTNIVPQMFFQFRASALYLTTSPLSNSTANITVYVDGTSVGIGFNTSAGVIAVLNLIESEITTVSLTFVPAPSSPSRLDVTSLTLTVTDDIASSSSVFLPSSTLPPSATLPTIVLPTSSTSSSTASPSVPPAQASSKRNLVPLAVGIVLGLSLGIPALAVVGYIAWRRRRRRRYGSTADFSDTESSPHPSILFRNGRRPSSGHRPNARLREK